MFLEKLNIRDAVPLARRSGRDSVQVDATTKLLGVELLRFTSAMAVLFYHYNHFPQIAGVPSILRTDLPFYPLLWMFYDYGQFGVQIFWGISGYIFFWKYGYSIHAGAISASRFFWLRFSRLYPLHLATLMTVVGLQFLYRHATGSDYVFPANDLRQFLLQLIMANDWGSESTRTFNGPIWSVSAEVAVYVGFFLLLLRCSPSLKLCMSVVTAGLVLRSSGIDSVPLLCALFFFAGGMAAQIREPGWAIRSAAAAVGACILWVGGNAGYLRNLSTVPTILLFALPFFLLAFAGNFPGLGRFRSFIQSAGNLTYSTYLLSFPIQLLLAVAVVSGLPMPDLRNEGFLLAYLASVIVAGVACYRVFELPAQAWIRRRTIGRHGWK